MKPVKSPRCRCALANCLFTLRSPVAPVVSAPACRKPGPCTCPRHPCEVTHAHQLPCTASSTSCAGSACALTGLPPQTRASALAVSSPFCSSAPLDAYNAAAARSCARVSLAESTASFCLAYLRLRGEVTSPDTPPASLPRQRRPVRTRYTSRMCLPLRQFGGW